MCFCFLVKESWMLKLVPGDGPWQTFSSATDVAGPVCESVHLPIRWGSAMP